MWKEGPQVDQMFRLIKKITPVIVLLYILLCCFVIRKGSQPQHNKTNYSIVINSSLAIQPAGAATEQER